MEEAVKRLAADREAAKAEGAAEERAKIVAYLQIHPDHIAHKGWISGLIEAGEHLK
jgi:hypothetical protein